MCIFAEPMTVRSMCMRLCPIGKFAPGGCGETSRIIAPIRIGRRLSRNLILLAPFLEPFKASFEPRRIDRPLGVILTSGDVRRGGELCRFIGTTFPMTCTQLASLLAVIAV